MQVSSCTVDEIQPAASVVWSDGTVAASRSEQVSSRDRPMNHLGCEISIDALRQFLTALSRKGVVLSARNDRLHYKAATGTLTAEDLANLRTFKTAILATLADAPVTSSGRSIFAPREARSRAPLSIQQRLFWDFLQRESVWNVMDTFALRLSGTVNVEAFRRSFEELVHRHGPLRTRIVVVDGAPLQIIDEPREWNLETVPVPGGSDAEREQNARCLVEQISVRKSDLAAGPLFDAKILRLTERDHVLVWAVHHILSDGFSINLMFREFWQLYARICHSGTVPANRLPAQYVDYAHWQAETNHVWMQKNQAYWDARLAGAEPIRWPVAETPQDVALASDESVEIQFGADLTAELSDFCRGRQTVPSIVLLAVYAALVSRWCQQDDFIVPFVMTGRDRSEHAGMVGYFAYELYLRITLTSRETYASFLTRIIDEVNSALSHQDFGRMVSRAPELLARSLFMWFPWTMEDIFGMPTIEELTGLNMEVKPFTFTVAQRSPMYDIATLFSQSPAGITGMVGYRANRFSGNSIRKFVEALRPTTEDFIRRANDPMNVVLRTAGVPSSGMSVT